jgi:hypothetical protein
MQPFFLDNGVFGFTDQESYFKGYIEAVTDLLWADDRVVGFTSSQESYLKGYIEAVADLLWADDGVFGFTIQESHLDDCIEGVTDLWTEVS